jgi:hypothetical protein
MSLDKIQAVSSELPTLVEMNTAIFKGLTGSFVFIVFITTFPVAQNIPENIWMMKEY